MAAELGAAERQLSAGWKLDYSACACAPTGNREWTAVLALVNPEARTMRCSSTLQASAGNARRNALASIADALRMIYAMAHREDGRQTASVVTRLQGLAYGPPRSSRLASEAQKVSDPGSVKTKPTPQEMSLLNRLGLLLVLVVEVALSAGFRVDDPTE